MRSRDRLRWEDFREAVIMARLRGTEDSAVEAQAVRQAVAAHAGSPGPLLPILQDVQSALGCVPPAAVGVIAEALNLSRADVYGVVSDYPDLTQRPRAAHRIRWCAGEACQARGSADVLEAIRAGLGVAVGERTADGTTSLDEVFCLGLCATAPALEIDGVPRGRLAPASVPELLGVRS